MKVIEADFVLQKNETAQLILAMHDRELLARVRAILMTPEPISQADLDAIDKSIAACNAGAGTPLEEYLKELDALE